MEAPMFDQFKKSPLFDTPPVASSIVTADEATRAEAERLTEAAKNLFVEPRKVTRCPNCGGDHFPYGQ
jgi:hypothetical protein